jgi:hypothetical protein
VVTEYTWLDEMTDPRVAPELDRLYPERAKLRPSDVAGLIEGFDLVDAIWTPTIEHARTLPSAMLHERVAGEYSFLETLRHLVFAWDAWLTRMVLRVPNAYHEWAVPPDAPCNEPADTGPELEPVLEVRADRSTRIRDYLAGATPADLTSVVSAPDPIGHPQGSHKVIDCFKVILNEEWWHHRFAVRDLAVLEGA